MMEEADAAGSASAGNPDDETIGPRSGYRRSVGILLLDRINRIFIGRRPDIRDGWAWQMPQGGIDDGEDAVAAGFREMEEEIGTRHAVLIGQSRVWRSYDLPRDIAARMWGGRYRGQTQLWLAMRFLGEESEISLTGGGHPEFDAYRWVDPEELPGLAVPFKRRVYERLVAEFRPLWAPHRPDGRT